MTNEKELNEKVAKWAGFKFVQEHNTDIDMTWQKDGISFRGGLPNFSESLDDCLQWLVPQLYKQGYTVWLEFGDVERGSTAHCSLLPNYADLPTYKSKGQMRAEHPALVLCRAIEQLRDKELA